MRIKQTKTGQISLKMDEEMWGVLTKALQHRIDLDWPYLETYECELAKEVAQKLWRRNQTGDAFLKLRRSEFHFIFCEAVMQYVRESHHAQINLAAEPFKHQAAHYKPIPSIGK